MTSTGVSPQKSATQSATEVIDRAEALSRIDGDGELMASLVDIFFSEAAPMMEAIRTAVSSNDPKALEKAGHRLKGSVSIFCADGVTQAALELENMGRGGDLTKAAETLVRLEQLMASVEPALKQFRSELQPSS